MACLLIRKILEGRERTHRRVILFSFHRRRLADRKKPWERKINSSSHEEDAEEWCGG
jgi:hypothetical protein